MSVGEPVAVTAKEAAWPTDTDCAVGCSVIEGPIKTGLTVRLAVVDVIEPAEFETVTE